ncbi:MAG: hypothetical protein ILA25_02245 [Prevotella sp.]|nr:hypothetical protein [Prevotella sp.]
MKRRNLLLTLLLGLCGGAMAQDAVHGVDGYYNWTPTQLKADGVLNIGGNGKKFANWWPEYAYTDDMQYVKYYFGINGNRDTNRGGGFDMRSAWGIKELTTGEGVMTMTSAYPVIAFKFSIPLNNESTAPGVDAYMEPEFSWYNPESEDGTNPGQTSGNKNRILLPGLDNNGRYRFVQFSHMLKDAFERDSAQLNRGNNGYDVYSKGKNTDLSPDEEVRWHIVRLNPGCDDHADFVLALNLYTIPSTVDPTKRMLDLHNVKIRDINFGTLNVRADTAVWNGDYDVAENYVRTKSREEMPYVYIKWIKTFESIEAFDASLTAENNWGDGPAVDPNKAVLNSALYQMQLLMRNYQFSDQITTLQNAYNTAVAVYNNSASTSADYAAQVEAMQTAQQQFMAAIAFAEGSGMTQFYSLTGFALGLSSQDVTVGKYTGKALDLVESNNAVDFLLTESGTVNGQKCYTVKTANGSMVQASDGTLLFVNPNQLTTSDKLANLVLSNRGTVDDPAYDFKVGMQYYYYDEDNGFTQTTEFPDAEDINDLAYYLFAPQAAEAYDPSDHDNTKYPMSAGEGSAFEFNEAATTMLEPAYEASFDMYEWDAAAKATATQRATQPSVEGWTRNGWSQRSDVGTATLPTGEKCLVARIRASYDDIHADSVNVAMVNTDFSETGQQTVSIMREHGKYNSALNRAPINNQQCDSLYYNIYLNSGINRYFAIKWRGTSESIKFNGIVFFVKKSVEEPNATTPVEQRGDVYVFDLLEAGLPYGDRIACAQYTSWTGLTSANEAVYCDWMRFYENLADVPTETMTVPTGIENVRTQQDINVTRQYFDLSGRAVSTPQKGVYVVKFGNETKKVVIK